MSNTFLKWDWKIGVNNLTLFKKLDFDDNIYKVQFLIDFFTVKLIT